MNPYRSTDLNSSPSSSTSSPPVIQTGHSSATAPPPPEASSDQPVQSPSSDLSLPAYSPRSIPESFSVSPSSQNPYPPFATLSQQVSVTAVSPDLRPSLQSQCSEESCPELECAICFSQFNNIFRCPKMLHCKHTFCLECLARINVKSAEPSAIQCPLCRGLTPLPTLGLPKLTTDQGVLSYLPAAMQRVYSIRFIRDKGKLQVKRSTDGSQRRGRRSLTSLRSINNSLDVGLPSPNLEDPSQMSGMGGTLFRLTGRPACRAFLLMSVVMMLLLLLTLIVFLLLFK
ncbi:RING finger protein 223 [Melanotaenia boesemani]|uniref:RING finger protein 223 n=1 Tax=Melanotaenia boesemani TaxID=1250792 RepID=UPI001C054CE9|nr:RING finger protein 223 [Melanotaenia boesemani]XP_041854240.1 RING finger protein 223 [Melanotaenia boesemani]